MKSAFKLRAIMSYRPETSYLQFPVLRNAFTPKVESDAKLHVKKRAFNPSEWRSVIKFSIKVVVDFQSDFRCEFRNLLSDVGRQWGWLDRSAKRRQGGGGLVRCAAPR